MIFWNFTPFQKKFGLLNEEVHDIWSKNIVHKLPYDLKIDLRFGNLET